LLFNVGIIHERNKNFFGVFFSKKVKDISRLSFLKVFFLFFIYIILVLDAWKIFKELLRENTKLDSFNFECVWLSLDFKKRRNILYE
jgi:hypothetical protein